MLCLIFTIFSLALTSFIHPWKENLTGLGWVKGHLVLMGLWNLYGCSLSFFLSWLYLEAEKKRLLYECCLSWIGLALGCLIPYCEGPIAFLGDLHSLVCVISFIFWLKGWSGLLFLSPSFTLNHQISKSVLTWFGVCLFLSVLVGEICFISEAGFVCGICWILFWAIKKVSDC